MAYRGVTTPCILWLLASIAFSAGCGGKSDTDGGNVSAASGSAGGPQTGGKPASSGTPIAGALTTLAGGASSIVGTRALSGGSPSEGTGGTTSANASGGSLGLGGIPTMGGAIGIGGATATGGKGVTGGSAPSGGKAATGGAAPTGGQTSTGGTFATGGHTATGGFVASGGRTSVGGSSSDAGDPLSAFCQGDQSKVLYQGKQEVLAPATNYVSGSVMNCCWVDGVNLHSRPTLGFDIDVDIIWAAGVSTLPRVVTLGDPATRVRTEIRRSTDDPVYYGDIAEGTLEIFSEKPVRLGLCLSLYKTGSLLFETLVYVPKVSLISTANQKRFQIFLLNDVAVTQAQAIAQGLNAVSLATSPLLDLGRIAYVSNSAREIGFNPGQKIGDSVRAALKGSTIQGIPFVIVAEGERITFGTFTSSVSSISYGLPTILVEEIKPDWLAFASGGGTTNPLSDSRLTTVLTATEKLIP